MQASYTTSRNCWDTFLCACPLNVGVQDMVTKLRLTTLRGRRGAREGKKKHHLVQVSQLFLSASVLGKEFEEVLTGKGR